MAIVSACTYDPKGRLVRPDRLAVGRARTGLDLDTGRLPTFEAGRTHVFVVSDTGVTSEHAHERVNVKLRRFFDRAETVRGFTKIAMSKTEDLIPVNRNVTVTYEILYAIESPERSRGRSPESPYAGSPRGRSVAFAG